MPEASGRAINPAGAAGWINFIVMSVIGLGWNAIKSWARNIAESHPWSLFEAAKANDVAKLRDLLARLPQQGQGPHSATQWLEYEDVITGWTSLMVAAAAGYAECVHLLLGAGAVVGHADRWGRTALHLAAQNAHVTPVQMLLQAGADPFVEDCKGYTTLDFALKLDPVANSISIVHMIEQRAHFSGWLNMKVVRFAGFRRIWERRYCLITPRRHNRRMHPDDAATYMLLTWFRSPSDFTVLGKVWLNGAEAVLDQRDSEPELTLTLQRNHERPSDAFVVTDTNGRHSLFLRGPDSSAEAAAALRSAAGLIPSSQPAQQRPPPAAGRFAAQPPASSGPAPGPRLPEAPQPQPVSHGRTPSLAEDEALARRLQAEEDARGASAGAASGSQQAAPQRGRAEVPDPGLYPDIDKNAQPTAPPMTAPLHEPLPSGGKAVAEDSLCVICQEFEATCGFLHGSSVHKCACKSCARLYQQPNAPKTCPMCRQDIQQVILDIF
jgi:hypothetical protein